ncbi:hypothetical protein E4U43_003694 [Claviceps pusilla]|uniref:Uncharacterized protein n=1 Tax=Claviceps pusilla TaxID=123648 RepID=A0A9P7NHP7_9HYPO|nr:hypothetical protein E4U43_003694 [Claviceps pusilla]
MPHDKQIPRFRVLNRWQAVTWEGVPSKEAEFRIWLVKRKHCARRQATGTRPADVPTKGIVVNIDSEDEYLTLMPLQS